MRRLRLVVLGALVGCLTAAIFAGSAAAIIIPKNGKWCGIDAPQELSGLHTYLVEHSMDSHYGSCSGAFSHVFDRYKLRSSKIVRFEIRQRKFLKNMYVGDEFWIGSHDSIRGDTMNSSENGHDVHGTFLSDFVVSGIIRLDGLEGWFYAVWVSP
jgi:hypothetical protein